MTGGVIVPQIRQTADTHIRHRKNMFFSGLTGRVSLGGKPHRFETWKELFQTRLEQSSSFPGGGTRTTGEAQDVLSDESDNALISVPN